jgi:hypothetical protein
MFGLPDKRSTVFLRENSLRMRVEIMTCFKLLSQNSHEMEQEIWEIPYLLKHATRFCAVTSE